MAESLLLDTHALIWAAEQPESLSRTARAALEDPDNEIFVSPVSAMEIATKFRLGKLDVAAPLARDFVEVASARGFRHLPLRAEHGQLGGSLRIPNKDPFDRLLIAQSQIERMRLVSNEATFDHFGVMRLW